jgi:hypothetical protein
MTNFNQHAFSKLQRVDSYLKETIEKEMMHKILLSGRVDLALPIFMKVKDHPSSNINELMISVMTAANVKYLGNTYNKLSIVKQADYNMACGVTSLHLAALNKNPDILSTLFKQTDANHNARNLLDS